MYGVPSRVETQRICVPLGILGACWIADLIPSILVYLIRSIPEEKKLGCFGHKIGGGL